MPSLSSATLLISLRLCEAVVSFGTEVVLHELTDLPDDRAQIPEYGAGNARMRRQGTRNLLAAAQAAGAAQFIAQSVAWQVPGDGGAAVEEHERAVLDSSGVVIRYGQFYGPVPTSSLSCRHRRAYMWTTPRVAPCPRSRNPAACWLFSRTSALNTGPAVGEYGGGLGGANRSVPRSSLARRAADKAGLY